MTLDDRARAELLATFRTELEDRCQALTRAFLSLEKEPEADERTQLLDDAFRSAHSLKGAARSVGLDIVETLSHGLEEVFGAVRRGERELSPELFDLLYAAVDILAGTFGEDGQLAVRGQAIANVLQRLEQLQAHEPAKIERSGVSASPSRTSESAHAITPKLIPTGEPGRPQVPAASNETVRIPSARLDGLLEQLGELVVPRLAIEESLTSLAELNDRVDAWQRDWNKVRPLLRQLERAGATANLAPLVHFLDRNEASLATLKSELSSVHTRLDMSTTQVGDLTDALQTEVKQLRMVPFGSLSESLERTVRDVARSLRKEVELILAGADVELDRRILEGVKDPLLHILRNAVDHGIESSAERRRQGKPSTARVVVTVAHRGGAVSVEVEDDGVGLDLAAIRRAAAERGLVAEPQLDNMGEPDVFGLIFLAGLSTKQDVSTISGRGMGLNVVAGQIGRLGGRVEVTSTAGVGTRFLLTLPLTLATTRGILVEAEGHLYALQTVAVERMLRVETIGSVGGRPMLEYEGASIPVVPLGEVLGARSNGGQITSKAPFALALVAAGAQRVGFIVDRVVGEQEMVMKPLGYPLRRVRHVSGASILGSGRIVPVLHAGDLVRSAYRSTRVVTMAQQPVELNRRQPRILVVDDALTTRTLERYILETAGYHVDLASDGLDALEHLQQQTYDVLVSDVDMPRLGGIALTEKLRQEPRFEALPIILVTSLDSDEDRERGLQAGADAYIVKSRFDQDQLLRAIREFVE